MNAAIFVTHLDVIHCAIGPVERSHDSVNSVAGITVNTLYSPLVDSQKVASGVSRHGVP